MSKYLDYNCPWYEEEICREHGLYFMPKCKAGQMKDNTCLNCPIYKFPDPHTNVKTMKRYLNEEKPYNSQAN